MLSVGCSKVARLPDYPDAQRWPGYPDAQRWPGYPGDCASWSQWCKTLEMESCIFQSVLSQSDSKLSLLDNAHNIVLCYSLTLHLCSGSIVGWGVTYCWTV